MTQMPRSGMDRASRLGLTAALAGIVVCVVLGVATDTERLAWSGLISFNYWLGITLGSMALMFLHQLSGGRWGVVVRRPFEAAAGTLPLLVVFFVVLMALGMTTLFEWVDPAKVEGDHILEHKSTYLNLPFFAGRAALYFLVWGGLIAWFRRRSAAQDESGDVQHQNRMRAMSGPGIVLYVLTISFASVDWVMSLDAHWYSTIFGVLTLGGHALSALAFSIAVVVLLAKAEPVSGVIKAINYHDLGKLMLAFVMLWAYFNLSQFLIIWAGNLPEEIPWYLRRMAGGWKWMGLALVFGHFALPFLLLLSADLKKRGRSLSAVAGLILVMRAVDMIWLIAPEFYEHRAGSLITGVAMDAAAIVGLGGLWVWFFVRTLRGRPVIPLHEPNLPALREAKH